MNKRLARQQNACVRRRKNLDEYISKPGDEMRIEAAQKAITDIINICKKLNVPHNLEAIIKTVDNEKLRRKRHKDKKDAEKKAAEEAELKAAIDLETEA